MTTNMGNPDRLVRGFVVAPIALVFAVLIGIGSPAGIVLAVVGVIMALTAVVGFCPLYRLFGFSSERHAAAQR
jgi:hypothetical protein